MTDDEALFILTDGDEWKMTGAFRNGTSDSVLAVDVGNPAEYSALPEHLRSACWPVSHPCVSLQASSLCLLRSPQQVRALAQWLLAASIALEHALENFDDEL